jgi:hypothetical protein
MSFLVSKRNSHCDAWLDRPPLPWAGAALGFIAVVNVTSALVTLISL